MSYIEREAAIKDLEDCRKEYSAIGNVDGACAMHIAKHVLSNQPTADVVEQKHGYWYFVEYEYFSCSECGESYYNGCEYTAQAKENLQNGDYYKYCPNCGAKMDGERSENGTN